MRPLMIFLVLLALGLAACQRGTNPLAHKNAPIAEVDPQTKQGIPQTYTAQADIAPVDK